MAATPAEPETLSFASRLTDLSARQDVADDGRWEQVASTARNLADRLRTREVDEHSALGQTPLPRTLTALVNEALAAPGVPSGPASLAVFELLRTSANFCMDHDDNRQLLQAASFPQSVVSLLHRYSAVQIEPQTSPVPLMELKILKTTAGVILNTSLYFDPIRDYFISTNVPEMLLRLQTRIYPPCSWSAISYNQNEALNVKEEWMCRSGFSNWASLALSELFRDNDRLRLLPEASLVPLVDILAKFTPPFPTPSGVLVEDPTTRRCLIAADVDLLNDVSSILEALALDSEDIQVLLAQTAAYRPSREGSPLIKHILDFVEFGDYPPSWSREIPSEQVKRKKAFDMCKAALIKTVVEATGALRCIDILWDLNQPNGWFVSRLIRWVQTNVTSNRDDLVVCATLCLGNLARRESHCIALVQPPFSLVTELASLLDVQVDIKVKHGALSLLKHLSQSPQNRATLGEVGILERLTTSEIWFENSDMAEIVQLSAIGTAKHLCTANLDNAIQLAVSCAAANPTGIDQILALVKRSDTVAVKSEGTRVIVNVVKSLCSQTQANGKRPDEWRKAIELVASSSAATALAELVGRSRKYPVLISEGVVALTLLSLQPSGSLPVVQALLAPLALEPAPTTSRSTSQSSQASPVSAPATCLTMLHNILSGGDNTFPAELRVNACSLLGSVGRRGTESGDDATFLRSSSGSILTSLAQTPPIDLDDRVRNAAEQALEAWN
ncbi:hypothetical protein JB92DRAFT_2735750 [Gautieria morchelliformis]|nr:hypothetical protein JB92DRAFT_2735750 [Gautieria morchelliformis]